MSFTLVPQRLSDVTLEVSFGGFTKTFELDQLVTDTEELQGGKQLSIDLTVKNGYIELGNVTIEGWETREPSKAPSFCNEGWYGFLQGTCCTMILLYQ